MVFSTGRLLLFGALMGIVGVPSLTAAERTAKPRPPGAVAAEVVGQPIFRKELNSPDIFQLRKRLFDMEQASLQRLALKRLREKRPREFALSAPEISDREVREFYVQADLKRRGSLKELAERIRGYLATAKREKFDSEQFAFAVLKGYVKTYLSPPPVFLHRMPFVRRAASQGPEDAPVHIVEFSDFQ
ncbi:MAG: hypothetical protein IIA14_10380 [SAR324 cluster bacterium]|nr:hypothetical protein [SAR324 cluster bacterium]